MGGGWDSSSDEMEGESGGSGGAVGGCLELMLQKWKKLGAVVSGMSKIWKRSAYSRSALSFLCSTARSGSWWAKSLMINGR